MNRIGGIMVRLSAWSVVDRGVAGADPGGGGGAPGAPP